MHETTFIGLYRGRSVADADLIAVTSQRRIVEHVLRTLVGDELDEEYEGSAREPLPLRKTDQEPE